MKTENGSMRLLPVFDPKIVFPPHVNFKTDTVATQSDDSRSLNSPFSLNPSYVEQQRSLSGRLGFHYG